MFRSHCPDIRAEDSPHAPWLRYVLADVPIHVVHRGNNRQAVFFDENDCRVYLDWLGEAGWRTIAQSTPTP